MFGPPFIINSISFKGVELRDGVFYLCLGALTSDISGGDRNMTVIMAQGRCDL